MYRRRVVRFIWDFCKKPVAATKLPSAWKWFGEYQPKVGRVVVELVGQEGKIYLGFEWQKALPCVETGYVVDLIKGDLVRDADGQRLFEGVLYGRPYEGYDEICVEFNAVNGEHFTYTAMERCRILFERLGMKVKDTLPLVGNFTQESSSRRGDWMDFGTTLYLAVFENIPVVQDLSGHRDRDRAT